MKNFPLVTIGIPTVSRLNYLREAVHSALDQDYSNFEVVISQNLTEGGLDRKTAEWGQGQAALFPTVKYFASARRLSLSGNFNAAADRARGKYLIIIGDDDRLMPTFLSELVEAIEIHGANVAFCNQWFIDASGARLRALTDSLTRTFGRDRLLPGLQREAAACVWRNSVPMSASLHRTADVMRLRFREDLNTPDIEFNARLAAEGARYVFVPRFLAEYRVHPGSETSAGLRYERLVDYLSDVTVPADCEILKRRVLEGYVCSIVKHKLLTGDIEEARKLFSHKHYPRFTTLYETGNFKIWLRGIAQKILAALPGHACAALMTGYEKCRRMFPT